MPLLHPRSHLPRADVHRPRRQAVTVPDLNTQTREISPEEAVADLREALDGWFAELGIPITVRDVA